MFSGGIEYTTCLIIAGVNTLATRREYLTKPFFCGRVLPETLCLHYLLPEIIDPGITNKLRQPNTFQSLTVKTERFRTIFIRYCLCHYQ